MKKPNKIYRKLGGRRSAAGSAFAAARHPVRSLRSVFGWDKAAQDVAEGLNIGPTRHAFQMVMSTIKTWSKSYRGPKLSFMFSLLSQTPRRPVTDTRRPEFD